MGKEEEEEEESLFSLLPLNKLTCY